MTSLLGEALHYHRADTYKTRYRFVKRTHSPDGCRAFLALLDLTLRGCETRSAQHGSLWKESEDCRGIHAAGLLTLIPEAVAFGRWSGCFFVTDLGYLGIGPEGVKSGDEVFSFKGARTPLILRSIDPEHKFVLLGDSYIFGLMAGEVETKVASGELQEETIVLR